MSEVQEVRTVSDVKQREDRFGQSAPRPASELKPITAITKTKPRETNTTTRR